MTKKRGMKRKYVCGNLSFGSNNSDFGRRNWYSHFVKLHIQRIEDFRELRTIEALYD